MKSNPIARYWEGIVRLTQQLPLQPGEVRHITVYHDDGCDLLNGRGPCNCTPTVKPGKPATTTPDMD